MVQTWAIFGDARVMLAPGWRRMKGTSARGWPPIAARRRGRLYRWMGRGFYVLEAVTKEMGPVAGPSAREVDGLEIRQLCFSHIAYFAEWFHRSCHFFCLPRSLLQKTLRCELL